MRRLVSTLFRAALVIGALAVVRAVLLDRAPRRELHGSEPVIGSLDSWPAVRGSLPPDYSVTRCRSRMPSSPRS